MSSIMSQYYGSSVTKALDDLFPDVLFDHSKFTVIPRTFLLSSSLFSSSFFLLFTFHPFFLLFYFIFCFYYLHLFLLCSFYSNDSKGNYWNEKTNRRKYFESIAKEKGFDALQPSHWYSLPRDSLLFSIQNGKYVNFKVLFFSSLFYFCIP